MGSESVAAALRQGAKDIVWAAARANLPNMAVVMAPINKGALRPPIQCTFTNALACHPRARVNPRVQNILQNSANDLVRPPTTNVPSGVTYEKFGTIQRRLAWPLHKDDTLSRSGRPTGLNIYFLLTMLGVYASRRAKVSRAGIQRSRPTLPSLCLRSRFHLPTLPCCPSL